MKVVIDFLFRLSNFQFPLLIENSLRLFSLKAESCKLKVRTRDLKSLLFGKTNSDLNYHP